MIGWFLAELDKTHSIVICNPLMYWLLEWEKREMQEMQHTHRKKGTEQRGVKQLGNDPTVSCNLPLTIHDTFIPSQFSKGMLSNWSIQIKIRKERGILQLKPCKMLPVHPVQNLRALTRQLSTSGDHFPFEWDWNRAVMVRRCERAPMASLCYHS